MALLVANYQWPNSTSPHNYSNDASDLITAVKNYEMTPATATWPYQTVNGDQWGLGNTCRNPSYQSPNYYEAYANFMPDQSDFWLNAKQASYDLINTNAHPTTGLVSNWSDPSGTPNSCNGPDEFGWDACRNPWRMGIAAAWYSHADAQAICDKIANFVNNTGVANLKGPLPQDGSTGSYHSPTFISTWAVGVMGSNSSFQSTLDAIYTETVAISDPLPYYFGNTLRALSLFAMTGNFWNPQTVNTPPTPAAPCKEIVGYYPSWQWYDRAQLVNPQTIDYSKYTVLNYAFFSPQPDGSINSTDAWADENLLLGQTDWVNGGYIANTSLVDLAHNNNVKVLPSIGGFTLSDNFPIIAASETTRNAFAAACVTLITTYNFDGIDLDWEYPGYAPHGGSSIDKNNFTLLLQSLRTALDDLSLSTGQTYLITAAVGAAPSHMINIDWATAAPLLDMINLMSYDFYGVWDGYNNHNSPLYASTTGDPNFSIDAAFTHLTTTYNVAPEKINIGLAFYGRSATGSTALFAPNNSTADTATFADDEGMPMYYNILKNLSLFTSYWDSDAQVPYLSGNDGLTTFVSYDNEQSIALKAQYIIDNAARGAIIWEITGDYIETTEGSGIIAGTPLVDTLNSVFCGNIVAPPLNSLPVATIAASNISGDAPLNIVFDANGSNDSDGSIVHYSWNFGDGNTDTGISVSYAFTLPGIYTVTLTVTDNDGGVATTTLSITVIDATPQAPTALATVDIPTGPYPLAVTFDASGSTDANNDALSYTWDFGDGTTGFGINPSHTYLNEGIYTIILTVSDGILSSEYSLTVSTFNAEPVAQFSSSSNYGTPPLAVTFDASSSTDANNDTLSYTWNFGDGSTETGINPSYTYPNEGIYTVTLTVSDGVLSHSSTTTITVSNSNCNLVVQYYNPNTNPFDDTIYLYVNLDNTSDEAIDLSTVSLRYWYTKEGTEVLQNAWCDYAVIGNTNITLNFSTLNEALPGADHYLEIGFTDGADLLAANSSIGEIQIRLAKNDWSSFDETDDWSYNSDFASYTPWENITAYCSDILVWGNEPSLPSTPSDNLALKVCLAGNYAGAGSMNNNLNSLIPTTQPYAIAPWYYMGAETLNSNNNNVVDWVLVELRDSNDPTIVVTQQAALLLTDGSIVSTDWLEDNSLNYTRWYDLSGNDSYHIVVQHRNHLAIISQNPQAIPSTDIVNLSDPSLVMDGLTQLQDMGDGYYALLSGDFNGDGVITVADFNAYSVETAQINQYLHGDFNLDGHVSVIDFNLYQVNASSIGVFYVRY